MARPVKRTIKNSRSTPYVSRLLLPPILLLLSWLTGCRDPDEVDYEALSSTLSVNLQQKVAELDTLMTQIDNLSVMVKVDDTVDLLNSSDGERLNRVQDNLNKVDDAIEKYIVLQTDITRLIIENEKLQMELRESDRQVEDYLKSNTELNQQLQGAKTRLDTSMEVISSLRADKKNSENKLAQLTHEKNVLEVQRREFLAQEKRQEDWSKSFAESKTQLRQITQDEK